MSDHKSAPTTIDSEVEEYFHYQLVCNFCGRTWWGLHCPHDGYQNPCPNCDRPPIPIKGDCTCVLVAPISTIAQEANKAVVAELETLLVIPGKYIDDGTMVYWSDFNASTLEQIIKDRITQLTADKEQAE